MTDATEQRLLRAASGQAEFELVGSMLLDESAIDEASRTVHPAHIDNEVLRTVFETLLVLRREDRPTTPEAVVSELGGQDGLIRELLRAIELVPNAAHADYYARQVHEDFKRRSFTATATETAAALKQVGCTADETLHDHIRKLELLLDDSTESDGHIAEHLLSADESEPVERFSTGVLNLDALLDGGFGAGQLVCIGARPSVGKTALCTGLAWAAAKTGIPTLFLSLEMSGREMTERIRRQFNATGMESYDQLNQLAELPLYVREAAGWSIDRLECEARRYARRYGVKLLFVDYLSLVRARDPRLPRYEQVADISRSLKLLALRSGLAVVAAQQLSRDIEKRESRRPRMSDFRESGSIEQDSDVLIGLDRPVRPDEGDRTDATLFLMKHRNGETGDLRLTYNPQRTLFTEY